MYNKNWTYQKCTKWTLMNIVQLIDSKKFMIYKLVWKDHPFHQLGYLNE